MIRARSESRAFEKERHVRFFLSVSRFPDPESEIKTALEMDGMEYGFSLRVFAYP
jgi:hypothetical protein